MVTSEDHLSATGLPGRWYAIAGSHRVGMAPLHVERLARQLVVWRDGAGTVVVQDDRCPHRGARLSQGRVIGDRIACAYHGVMVERDGRIGAVPALPGCPIEGRQAVPTYAALERGGIVFAYVPTEAGEAPPPFVGPPELTDPAWSMIPIEMEWRANWRYIVENALDPMHGPYLHGDSHSMSVGSKDDVLETVDIPNGFRVRRKLQADTAFDWVDFQDTGLMWVYLDIPYAAQVGPGGPFRIVGFSTPIDADRTYQFFYRFRRVQGWQRDLWHFLHKNRLVTRHWAVLEQDREVLETLPPDAREREMLYQHDIGVTRFRRHLRAEARALLAARAALH